MFEKLENPHDLFTYELGSALSMEQTVLKMLGDLQEATHDDALRGLFTHHSEETQRQIQNIEQSFELLGEKVDDKPCPAIQAIDKEGKSNMKKADDRFIDSVILSGAGETEHHEIAVYENLITQAEAMGEPGVVTLLRQNLEMEQHTLDEVKRASQDMARRTLIAA